ncbi:glycoside hydrolase domain-containing protein [Sanguibacter inulinus]|uniref:Glycoside hydrolase family 92 protein n=1 Tax=Sanguibacter inulinus TaxID=60922 RepID=A0A853EUB9_9MICO|nr:glycoside hydrolase domain-containing protein [Sanguibacter inulinus]MBF0721343.1 glycoside hydrolase family 92 protein [Sanguibacter inulinus]NYS92488.1 glycoside hydrolase family 92 protein [Sanguibacter inulinus]
MKTPSPSLSRAVPTFAPAATEEPDPSRCLQVDMPPGGGEIELLDLPGERGVAIRPGDALVYDVLPVAGSGDRYAATAVALDLRLDDGTRLSTGTPAPRDQHGTPLDPAAQAADKRLWVDQWNRRTVDLAPWVGRRIDAVLAVVGATSEATTVFVGGVRVRQAPQRPDDLLGWVDTRRGTHSSDTFSRGNTAPVVSIPHGGVFGLPMTDASAGNWPYRHQMAAPTIQAFATSHIPSPWIGDRGVFQLMPSASATPPTDRDARALRFERDDEHAGPDRYEVELDGVSVVLTAARHAIGLRARSHGDSLSLVVDHLGEAADARWVVEGGVLRLDVLLRDGGDRPDHHVHAVIPDVVSHTLTHADGELRGSVTLAQTEADVIIGVSTIDADQARVNATTAGTVDDMLREAAAAWRRALSAVEVHDPDQVSPDALRSLAGSLGRVLTYPNAYDEPGPEGPRYRSPVDGELRPGSFSATHGFWDTYRTAWPLLGLLAPDRAGALADGFVQHFTDAGWVARWSAPGPVDCMTGTTSDTVFAGLAAQGVPFRLDEAYRSALHHATVPASDARVGRKGLRPGIFRGYVDTRVHEGMSWTLDNAINDASAARLALALLDQPDAQPGPSALSTTAVSTKIADADASAQIDRLTAEADYLARRALGYRSVFHRGLGFFLGRDEDGRWRVAEADFDPAEWGHDYTETNAWGTAFTAPHDGAGLAELHGGEVALGAALDAFFATPETADPALVGSYGFVIHEMSEARDVRMGMLGLSNQPAHHIPLTYCFAGRHDEAHRVVVEARDRLFVGSEIGQGYPGDEDNGEMSAWYLFAVLGLYPLVPGTGEMVLTPPLLPRVTLHPQGRDHPLEITAENAGAPYVREVRVDGQVWERVAVPADVLSSARHIAFVLSDEPTGWARDSRPTSISTELGLREPLRDLLVVEAGGVTDDRGDTVVALAAGEQVELALTEPAVVSLYTVTLAGEPAGLPAVPDPVVAAWRLEGVTADGTVVPLDVREETFDLACQTRPFRTRPDEGGGGAVVAVRLTALSQVELSQIEVFGPV